MGWMSLPATRLGVKVYNVMLPRTISSWYHTEGSTPLSFAILTRRRIYHQQNKYVQAIYHLVWSWRRWLKALAFLDDNSIVSGSRDTTIVRIWNRVNINLSFDPSLHQF